MHKLLIAIIVALLSTATYFFNCNYKIVKKSIYLVECLSGDNKAIEYTVYSSSPLTVSTPWTKTMTVIDTTAGKQIVPDGYHCIVSNQR